MQLFLIHPTCPDLCAVVYRPPKYNKDLIPEFAEQLSELLPKYNGLLIAGDFNIHVCCPPSSMVNEFPSLLASLGLTHVVNSSTQWSYGLDTRFFAVSSVVFDEFVPVSLSLLSEEVQQLSPTNCPLDIIPTGLLQKFFFNTVGPHLLLIINKCLCSGSSYKYLCHQLLPGHVSGMCDSTPLQVHHWHEGTQ